MARKKKESEIDNSSPMTKEQAWNFADFVTALYGNVSGYGYYNPFEQHNNLVELNNDPLVPTYDRIIKALKSVPYNYKELRGYSEFMEVFDSIYANTLRYMRGLLSFDLSIECTNIKDPKTEYNSDEYKDDLKRVYKFLDNFDYKQEFGSKVLPMLLRDETTYVWFRDTHEELENPIKLDGKTKIKKNEKFGLQIMPQDYCKVTGYYNSTQLLYDFDMNYFLKGNVDIDLYPSALKKAFARTFKKPYNQYKPSAQLNERVGGYAMWVQTNPNDGAYAFKMDMSNFRQVPPYAYLLKSCFNNSVIEELQTDKDFLTARAFLYGTIRLFDNAKTGTQKNQFAIDPKTLGNLMALVAGSLKKNVQPLAMPTEDNKMFQLTDSNSEMAETQYDTSASQGVSASSLVYTTEKMAQFELQNAIETDYTFIKQIYLQFNAFMNFFVNKKTAKYKFRFEFDGLERTFYRKERRQAVNELMTVGLMPNLSYIASAYGIRPQTFQRMLEESHYGGLTELLTLPLNNNTTVSGSLSEENSSGRPTLDDTEITDNGSTSKEYL